jgi:hypothetical protein
VETMRESRGFLFTHSLVAWFRGVRTCCLCHRVIAYELRLKVESSDYILKINFVLYNTILIDLALSKLVL